MAKAVAWEGTLMVGNTKAKVPAIRFKGHSELWSEKRISEICSDTLGGGTPKTSESKYWTGTIPWIQSSDVLEGEIYSVKPKRFITQEAISNSATKIVPQDSIAVVTRVGVGKLSLIDFQYATSQDFLSLSGLAVDRFFAVRAIALKLMEKLHETQGTSIKGITKEELINYIISVPMQKLEQQKVGNFFKQMDTSLEYHQAQLDKLNKLKQAMLQKMFPQDNATEPEIRFKGFSGEWAAKKIGDIFEYERPDNYIVSSSDYSDKHSTPVLTANKAFILGYTDENKKYTNNCIIFDDFTLDSKYVDFPFMVKSSALKILTVKNKSSDDLYFSYYLLIKAKIEIMGHARHYISVVQPTIVLTTTLEEQQKIGAYFRKLDELIALERTQLEKLKQIKQSCLAGMFV